MRWVGAIAQIGAFAGAFLLCGCTVAQPGSAGTPTRAPNPASIHCVESGHLLTYEHENGLPVRGVCVNQETGVKCPAWAYFRRECSLEPPRKEEESAEGPDRRVKQRI